MAVSSTFHEIQEQAMSESIHGHEVMRLMLERGGSFTRESLRDTVVGQFGAGARFHTCSAEDMTAEELIDFLAVMGKFVEADGGAGFNTQPEMICKH
jgi:probable metal-binding protein